ncbi:hypothetical protein HELRODRAFT_178815 [Helobdella robusta]|uniref:Uncharacterized protein n=1 Tax=Helobdella robusta TaxID=6412 RepID=T1FDS3_HELRO|nr:hypothetical protein HELRODRAFT_178815 [Helobdella robusta]ESN95900.1 hypothetical protein HELRODRAFT_178815 [Helobdella robusta]
MTTPCYKNRMDSDSKLTTENTRMTSSFLIIVIVTSVFLSTQMPRISAQDGGYYVAAGTRILFVKAPNTDVIYEDVSRISPGLAQSVKAPCLASLCSYAMAWFEYGSPLKLKDHGTHVSLSKIITVAYDGYEVSGKGLLFWSDISVSRKRIFKAKIEKAPDITEEGTLEMNINVDAVTGLALDWRTNNIYFTSEKDQTISACAYTYTDFTARCKVIIFTDLQRPRGITLDLDASYLFWSDQKTMKVERSMLDGSNRTTLVTNAQLPNHMVTHRSKLYWVNSDNKTLERCDYSGSNHIIVASLKNLVEDTHIFGLSVLNRLSGNPGIGPNNNNSSSPPTPTPAQNIPPPTSAPFLRDEFIITTLGKLMVRVVVPLGQDCGVAERYMSYAKASALFGVAHYNGVLNQTRSSTVCISDSVNLLCFPVNGAAVYACPSHSLLILDPSARACVEPTRILLFAMADQGVVAMVGNPRSVTKAELHIHVKFVRRSSRPIAVAYDDYRQVAVVYYSQQCLLFYTNVGSVTINQVKYNWHTLEVLDVCDVNGPKKIRVLTRSGQKLRGLAIDGK